MNAMKMIEAALAAPKTHAVITKYADGRERRFETRSLASAKTHASVEGANMGRDLIDRATGKTVRKVSVEIVEI